MIYGIGSTLKKFIGIFLVPFYTRALSPAEYGILDSLGTFVGLLSAVTGLGLMAASMRFYVLTDDKYERGRILFTSAAMQVVVNIFVYGFILIYAKNISILLFKTPDYRLVISIITILIITNPLVDLQMVIIRYARQVWKFVTVSSLRAVIQASLGILFVVVLRKGVLGANLASVITTSLVFLFSYILYTRRHYTYKFSFEWGKKMLKYGYPLIGAVLSQWVFSVSDRFFLLRYSELDHIGLYSIGTTFSQPVQLINTAINMSSSILILTLFQKEKESDNPKTKKFINDIWRLYLVIAIPICLILSIFSVEILTLLTTVEYVKAAIVIPLLLFSLIIAQSYILTAVGMDLMLNTKPYFWILLTAALTNVILNFWFIPRYSYIGAAITTLISNMVYFIIGYIWSQKYFFIRRELVKVFLFISITFVISMICPYSHLFLNFELPIYIKIVLFAVGASVSLIIGFIKIEELMSLFHSIKQKISNNI